MDLQPLKNLIQTHPEYRGQPKIMAAFNDHTRVAGRDRYRQVPLAQAAAILGYGTDVRTYHAHVRFAKLHDLQSFTYKSTKTGKTKTYRLEGDQYRPVQQPR